MKILNFKLLIFLLFLITHIYLLNINYAEWGDSYQILRASSYIKNFSYPSDEKRPPLFPILLSTNPNSVDPIFWGRVVMLFVSLFTFFIFSKLSSLLSNGNKTAFYLSLMLFSFNPILLYWSLRIMSDVFFTSICLLTIYLTTVWKNNITNKRIVLLGFLSGLAVLTRFEGYILGFSLLLWLGFEYKYPPNNIRVFLRKIKISKCLVFLLPFLIIIFPYIYYKNPLLSSYLTESQKRVYDLNTLLIFFTSLVFSFGFIHAIFFMVKATKPIKLLLKENLLIAYFLIFQLLLTLLWPAAIPRLFTSILPYLIILLSLSVVGYFKHNIQISLRDYLFLVTLIVLFPLLQFFFKLQFLVVNKVVFAVLIFLSLLSLIMLHKRNLLAFLALILMSTILWSLTIIWSHKDVYRTLLEASLYAKTNLKGTIGLSVRNDVSQWYLGNRTRLVYQRLEGEKIIIDNADGLDYILSSNELYADGDIDLVKLYPNNKYELVKSFNHKINGRKFYTKILRVIP